MDVDYSSPLPNKILVKRSGLNFFVCLGYRDLLDFCNPCSTLGHKLSNCQKIEVVNDEHQGRIDKEDCPRQT